MKFHLPTWIAVFGCITGVSLAVPSQESPREIWTAADFDADGHEDLLIADKETGEVRVLWGNSDGSFTADAPIVLGPGLQGLVVADFGSGAHDHAVFALENAGALPVMVLDGGLADGPRLGAPLLNDTYGPGKLAALRLNMTGADANRDDLVLGTTQNGAPGIGAVESFRTTFPDGPVHYLTRYLSNPHTIVSMLPLRLGRASAQPEFLAMMLGTTSDIDMITLDASSAIVDPALASDVVTGMDTSRPHMVAGHFGPALKPFILTFGRNQSMVHSFAFFGVPGSAENTDVIGPDLRNFPTPLAGLVVVPGEGMDSDRLLVTFAFGTERAALYEYDGQNFPTKITGFAAPSGGDFSGAVALPNGDFLLMESTGTSPVTSSVARYDRDGNFIMRSFAPVSPALAGSGNVIFYSDTPLANPLARVVAVAGAGDWSSGVATEGPLASPFVVMSEVFQSDEGGLGAPAAVALGAPPAGSGGALGNQFASDISTFNFGAISARVEDTVTISPQSGSYREAIGIEFFSAENARQLALGQPETHDIYYRIDTGMQGEWKLHTSGSMVQLVHNATVRFFSISKTGLARSNTRTATFSFENSGSMDSDGDGVPDHVEIAMGLDPLGGVDSDGDGYSDLEEIFAGTNPNDPDSNPGRLPGGERVSGLPLSGVFALNLEVEGRFGNGGSPESLPLVDGASIQARSLDGALLGNAATDASTATFPALSPDSGTRFIATLSPTNFLLDKNPSPVSAGREIAALVPVPDTAVELPFANYNGFGDMAAAAEQWTDALRDLFRPESGHFKIGSSANIPYNATAAQIETALNETGGGTGFFNGVAVVTGEYPLFHVTLSNTTPNVSASIIQTTSQLAPASEAFILPLQDATEDEPEVRFHIYIARTPPVAAAQMDIYETLLALLVETKLGDLLGINEPTLLPSRPQDLNRTIISAEALSQLDSGVGFDAGGMPVSYSLQGMIDAMRAPIFAPVPQGKIPDLKMLVELIYETSSEQETPPTPDPAVIDAFRNGTLPANQQPPTTPTPIDALRAFIATGEMPAGYPSPDPLLLENAFAAVQALLDLPEPRPVVDMIIQVSHGGSFIAENEEDPYMHEFVHLYAANGSPYSLDASMTLTVGTRLLVRGYADVSGGFMGETRLEVISLTLLSLPDHQGTDSDGNLLVDQWEQIFFGETGQNPYAIGAGGKSLIQLYLDGTAPDVNSDTAVADLSPPRVRVEMNEIQEFSLHWEFPGDYAPYFNYTVETNTDLVSPFQPQYTAGGVMTQGDENSILIGLPSYPDRQFWRMRLGLKTP